MPREVFDIFLSSTSRDLVDYRAKVTEGIERLGQTTVRMETFGAKPQKPLDACRDEVQGCDALVVVVGHRYGWVPGEDNGGDGAKSITWWEVQWALDEGKPVYAFVVDDEAPWSGEREQDRMADARTDEEFIAIGKAVQQLKAFRSFLGDTTTWAEFTSPDDLALKVATSLHDWIVEQSMARARRELEAEADEEPEEQPDAGKMPEVARVGSTADETAISGHGYPFEQVHALSARDLVATRGSVHIALIAGHADSQHPALATAELDFYDVRQDHEPSVPDDFTTAVAGVLVGNDPGSFTGLAPSVHLSVIQTISSHGAGSNVDLLIGVDTALRLGARAICVPLGSISHSAVEEATFARAASLGVAVICPAGNNSDSKPSYPGGYPDTIAVAAVDSHDRPASFTSFGDWVTTAAPGVDVAIPRMAGGYRRMSGTSFACAIAAATVALMLQADPELEPNRIKEILGSVGPPLRPSADSGTALDLRRLDAYEAVLAALA